MKVSIYHTWQMLIFVSGHVCRKESIYGYGKAL